ncbi:MAG: orotate phosphoribosyltransferase [Actinomycetota bacterium]
MGNDLAARLIERSEIHGDFTLSSGERSSIYFDKFRFLSDPEMLREVAGAVRELIPSDVEMLASPEGAATLLLAAVSLETGKRMAVVRKEPKEYGTRALVEGEVPKGTHIALIEDVSTTGGQTLKAARALQGLGGEIALIVLTIDRGGGKALREAGYRVESIAEI